MRLYYVQVSVRKKQQNMSPNCSPQGNCVFAMLATLVHVYINSMNVVRWQARLLPASFFQCNR